MALPRAATVLGLVAARSQRPGLTGAIIIVLLVALCVLVAVLFVVACCFCRTTPSNCAMWFAVVTSTRLSRRITSAKRSTHEVHNKRKVVAASMGPEHASLPARPRWISPTAQA